MSRGCVESDTAFCVNIVMRISRHYKEALIQSCIEQQQLLQESILSQIHLVEEAAKNYGPNKDRYDGFRNQQVRQANVLDKQLQSILSHIELLQAIQLSRVHDIVSFGALLETDRALFLICTGLGVVAFRHDKVVVLSMTAPIFSVMDGKRSGERFTFNGVTHHIEAII